MHVILDTIQAQGWSLGQFLYNVFRSTGRDANRSQRHAQMASAFLGGRGKFTPSSLLNCWMKSPDGVLSADSPHLAQMFSTETPYTEIGPIRPALTSFALQTVGTFFARRAEDAIKASKLTWAKFGADTISTVGDILDHHLSAAWYLMDKIAMRKPRTREGVVVQRKTRPSSGVIIHALSDLLFCRSQDANLLPLARGILYFGSSVPVEIMAYNCRIGTMPAYSTIHRNLKSLSSQEAAFTVTHGRDANGFGYLLFDNVQNLARVRDLRIGRENHMNVGMSALWVEGWSCIDVQVFELADKRRYIGHNARASLTVDQLFGFLDQEDADLTGFHQWLEVLVRCIKPLNSQIPDVQALSRGTSKLLAPLEKSVVHPLGPSGKKETIPSELKEGLLDFFAQVGQLPGDYLARKLIVGGDGLSYAMLLQLQTYLQFHKDPFKSFEIIEPQLQVWHTKWTDLIRIFQTHWGRTSGKSNNPASLGHSAGKIGRHAPSNMKKVEFYPGSQLLYLVLDARMLDCWSLMLKTEDIFTYFNDLEAANRLPDLAHLSEIAKNLHRTYSSARARDHAQFDLGRTSMWAKTIPEGSPWVPVDIEDSSLDKTKKKRKSKTKKEEPPKAPCKGDFVLGQAIDFFRDALNSRKIATSVANGDIARLYECIKYMLFTFSGSTHTNYMGYVLETVVNLELESSPGLRTALLLCEIVNLRGIYGHFEEGDYVVEFFNRLLEDIVQRKNAQFDDDFIRNVVSRNLRQIAELKLAWRTGTGMTEKSRAHTDPHSKPEMCTLLTLYRTEQLHSRRLGRQIDDRDTDDFARGARKLRNGGLDKFVKKTLRTRRKTTPQAPVEHGDSSDDSDESDEELDPVYATRGSMAIVNGQLVMDERDMMDGPSGEDLSDERDTEFTMGPEGVDEDGHEPEDLFNDNEAE
ncbi:hypothetical protein DFH06DRAFT_1014822 [Mycena polygramma]|nr:hypothetical protein DFH06DRAFT_1014822 [Mycena polygramma]